MPNRSGPEVSSTPGRRKYVESTIEMSLNRSPKQMRWGGFAASDSWGGRKVR